MTNNKKRYIKKINGMMAGFAKEQNVHMRQCRDYGPKFGKEVNGEILTSYKQAYTNVQNILLHGVK